MQITCYFSLIPLFIHSDCSEDILLICLFTDYLFYTYSLNRSCDLEPVDEQVQQHINRPFR